jgi:acyl-CoA thioester hydrolase
MAAAKSSPNRALFRHEFTVPPEALDRNEHVNNVVYVQWMQDVAIRHSNHTGGTRAASEVGATWVVRSHRIDYLRPAFAGDRIEAVTWVANFRRVRSLRRYRFLRTADGTTLAEGETDWVFVDAKTGRPRAIPSAVVNAFHLFDGFPSEAPSVL